MKFYYSQYSLLSNKCTSSAFFNFFKGLNKGSFFFVILSIEIIFYGVNYFGPQTSCRPFTYGSIIGDSYYYTWYYSIFLQLQRKKSPAIMIYSNTASQIVEQLLKASKPGKILKQNDQMLLMWNKSQLVKRWPKCMVPVGDRSSESQIDFTSMLYKTKQKAYQYDRVTKLIEYDFKNQLQEQLLIQNSIPDQPNVQNGNNEEIKVVEPEGDKLMEQKPASQGENKLINKSSIKSQPVQHKQKLSPFLPNYDNPFDRNINAKALKHKFQNIKLHQNNRNIAAIIQGSKRNEQLKQSMKFGKSMPKRTMTNSIDISDILKYTLGVKRQEQRGVKPEPIKNPFVRVPPKYYQSLGDFYGGSK